MTGWVRRLVRRVRYRSFDADLRQELETHRAMAERDRLAAGLSPADARRAASRALGNVTLAREDARGVWVAPWLEGVWQDLRFGARALRRSPAFTITAVVTMAIGIGLSTAIFTTFAAVFLRPWPVRDPGRVAQIELQGGSVRRWGFGQADLDDFAARSTTLSHVAASRTSFLQPALDPAAQSENVYGEFVTANYFAAVGVSTIIGRAFHPTENRPGAESVAVISYPLWQRLFAGAADVLGRPLYFQGKPYLIIGVTEAGWRGPQPYRYDIWLPLEALRSFRPNDELFSDASGRCCVRLLGRLAPGATHARAAQELTALLQQRAVESEAPPSRVAVTGTRVWDEAPAPLRALASALVVAATLVILLLTGANIAHLQLARAFARLREIRTRLALGAARARVVRQLVTEAGLLSLVGGAGGLALLYLSLPFLMRVSEMESPEVWAPDVVVFGYCAAVSLLMSLTFSLAPALRSTRLNILPVTGQTVTAHAPMRFSLALLTSQIALSAVLLTGASLLTRAVVDATSRDLGFDVNDVIVATYRPAVSSAVDRSRAALFGRSVQAALAASMPQAIAYADAAPFSYSLSTSVRRAGDDQETARSVDIAPVSANTFSLLGIPLVAGRTFSDRVEAGEAVVNERLADLLWPDGTAIGQRVIEQLRTYVVGGPAAQISGQRPPESTRTYVIVGVVRDVFFTRRDAIRPTIHMPVSTSYPAAILRGGPADVDRLKAAITGVDPQAAILIRRVPEIIASRLGDSRFAARGAWAGGLLALALATFGVFGVFAFAVEQRRREIGIRVALGASHIQVLAAMFRAARTAVLAGLAAGLVLSLGVGPVIEQALFGLSPFDPMAFALVAALLAAAGFAATFIPARRALSIDPAVILKNDG